jgi:hypothetical protein
MDAENVWKTHYGSSEGATVDPGDIFRDLMAGSQIAQEGRKPPLTTPVPNPVSATLLGTSDTFVRLTSKTLTNG